MNAQRRPTSPFAGKLGSRAAWERVGPSPHAVSWALDRFLDFLWRVLSRAGVASW